MARILARLGAEIIRYFKVLGRFFAKRFEPPKSSFWVLPIALCGKLCYEKTHSAKVDAGFA